MDLIFSFFILEMRSSSDCSHLERGIKWRVKDIRKGRLCVSYTTHIIPVVLMCVFCVTIREIQQGEFFLFQLPKEGGSAGWY